jgi:hypothetical protein
VSVDEMDLASEALDVAPWQPEAYEQARTVLRAAMAESDSLQAAAPVTAGLPVRGRGLPRAGNRRRRSLGTRGKVGIGAGIGAVAAAAAVAIAITSAPQPPAPAGPAAAAPTRAAAAAPTGAAAAASPLATLAARITAAGGSLPGNASLIIRTQTIGGGTPDVSYNLYTDGGAFYGGGDKKSLMQAIARHENDADGILTREVAAARFAVNGDLTTARRQMVNASPNSLGLGLSPAARKIIWAKAMAKAAEIYREKGIKEPKNPPSGQRLQELAGNYLWNNSVDALSAGAGSPQVRAGVLRLLSTIPEVTVQHSTTGGQPTLTLTAGSALFLGGAPEVLTVNAKTGMPIRSAFRAQGNVPSSVSTFQVSRVTLAGVEAGKF